MIFTFSLLLQNKYVLTLHMKTIHTLAKTPFYGVRAHHSPTCSPRSSWTCTRFLPQGAVLCPSFAYACSTFCNGLSPHFSLSWPYTSFKPQLIFLCRLICSHLTDNRHNEMTPAYVCMYIFYSCWAYCIVLEHHCPCWDHVETSRLWKDLLDHEPLKNLIKNIYPSLIDMYIFVNLT